MGYKIFETDLGLLYVDLVNLPGDVLMVRADM